MHNKDYILRETQTLMIWNVWGNSHDHIHMRHNKAVRRELRHLGPLGRKPATVYHHLIFFIKLMYQV
jgi:hypothetical protein